MTLGPKTQAFFEQLAAEAKANPAPAFETIPLDDLRAATIAAFEKYAEPLPSGVREEDFVSSIIEELPCVTYTPSKYNSANDATLIFFFGSAFVFDILRAHYSSFAKIANESNCKIIAFHYPFAPEYKSQAINEAIFSAVNTVVANAEKLDINPKKIDVAGYSSGGNLAAQLVYRYIKSGCFMPFRQLILINPWLDFSFKIHNSNPFVDKQNQDKLLTTEALQYCASLYLEKNQDSSAPEVSSIFIEKKILVQFPPVWIISAEYDRLRGTADYFARQLEKAGVLKEELIVPGQTHNFFISRAVLGDGVDPALLIAERVRSG